MIDVLLGGPTSERRQFVEKYKAMTESEQLRFETAVYQRVLDCKSDSTLESGFDLAKQLLGIG